MLPVIVAPPIAAGSSGIKATGVMSGIRTIDILYRPAPPTLCISCEAKSDRVSVANAHIAEDTVKVKEQITKVLRRPNPADRWVMTRQRLEYTIDGTRMIHMSSVVEVLRSCAMILPMFTPMLQSRVLSLVQAPEVSLALYNDSTYPTSLVASIRAVVKQSHRTPTLVPDRGAVS
jgi:hypothetical protein